MSGVNRRSAVALGAAPVLTIWGSSVRADRPPLFPALYDGGLVYFTVVNQNVVGIDQRTIEEDVAIPLYSFGPPGHALQPDVLSSTPGEAGYNPHWEVFRVIVLNGRDVTTDSFLSDDEILDAEERGGVMVIETDFIFLCRVISR